MRRLPHLADFRANVLNGQRSRSIKQVKGAGETKIAMIVRRVFLLVGRRDRAAVRCVLAELGERKAVEGGSLG